MTSPVTNMVIPGGCPHCGYETGYTERSDEHDHVGLYCSRCGRWLKWISKRDAGVTRRSMSERTGLTPSLRFRILQRDGFRCVLCGDGQPEAVRLVIGHIISVNDGLKAGIPDEALNHEDNLCVLCENCNAGMGRRSFPMSRAFFLYQTWRLRGAA